MSDLGTFLKMQNRVAEDMGLTLADHLTKIKDAINDAGDQFMNEHNWPFKDRRGVVLTVASESTGTVSVTNGSVTVTGSGTAFVTTMAFGKFALAINDQWYEIDSADAGAQTLTLDRNFEGTTASGITYVVYQDVYSLAATAEELRNVHFSVNKDNGYELDELSQGEIEGWIPRSSGKPYWYAKIEQSSSDLLQIQVGPKIPDDVYTIRYGYRVEWTELTDDTDVPIVPARFREIVIEGANSRMGRIPQFKGSDVSAAHESTYERMVMKAKARTRQSVPSSRVQLPGRRDRRHNRIWSRF